jgi:hypothetical protein
VIIIIMLASRHVHSVFGIRLAEILPVLDLQSRCPVPGLIVE